MSQTGQLYGEALPDQVDSIFSFIDVQLELISDVREIYRECVVIEKEYAAKLQSLYRKATEKKGKMDSFMVVGPEPTKSWSHNTISQSTLYAAYTQLVNSIAQISQDHVSKADAISSQTIDSLKSLEKKNEDLKKKEIQYFQKLVAERDRTAADRAKCKQKYDEEALEADAVQQKQVQAKDDKHADRVARQAEQQRSEMLNCKNSYLISIAIANSTKNKFYGEDVPRLEDQLQILQSKMLQSFSSIIQNSQTLQIVHVETLKSRFTSVETTFQRLNPSADQDIFIDHHIRPYTTPPDLSFEPCMHHYDTDVINTDPGPKVYLQNRLSKSRSKLRELEPVYEAKCKELNQYLNLFNASGADGSVDNPEDLSEKFVDVFHQTTFYATSRCVLSAEVDTIVGAIGDDEGSQHPHTFKSSSFSIPTQCGYCKASIWGLSKQGKTCKQCGLSVHTKCELKVPADCGLLPQGRTSTSSSVGSQKAPPPSTSSIASTKPTSIPTPSSFVTSSSPEATLNELPLATLLYDFAATSNFEISLKEGTPVRVVEADDGSGWVKVADSQSNSGLVPASYVEYQEDGIGEGESPAQKVRAIYDYQAQGPDELGLQAGQVLDLTLGPSGGKNYGEGWWEGLDSQGKQGIFPSNYVELA